MMKSPEAEDNFTAAAKHTTITTMFFLFFVLAGVKLGENIPEFSDLLRVLMPSPPGIHLIISLFSLGAVSGALTVYWMLSSNFLYNTGNVVYGELQYFSSFATRISSRRCVVRCLHHLFLSCHFNLVSRWTYRPPPPPETPLLFEEFYL